jgi:hypothetical protein
MKIIQTGLLALFATSASVVYAATIYVDSSKTDDLGTGADWSTAKKTIQAAIDIAGENDTVLIAAGTYQISSSLTISGDNKDIELRGATGNPADVVVDAQGLCPCLVSSGRQIIVSSMTFENGRSTSEVDVAGGITATEKSLVTNCIVRDCCHVVSGTNVHGGGINLTSSQKNSANPAGNWPAERQYLPQVVNTVVENCAVYTDGSGNKIYALGGGVYLNYHNSSGLTVRDCVVTNFSAAKSLDYTQGGGAWLYAGRHENDVFAGNTLENPSSSGGYLGTGAGVYVVGSAAWPVVLADSFVVGNLSRGCGAGVGVGASATVDGCSVVSNRLSHGLSDGSYQIGGAGIYISGDNSQIANTLVADNISTNEGNVVAYAGAINVNDSLNAVIRSCVIRDNVLQQAGAISCISAGGLLVSNCVMYGNVAVDRVSTVRFYTNQSELEKCGRSLIADCYIVSNAVKRDSAVNDAHTLLYYASVAKNRIAAPLTLRNCLFAGNQSNDKSSRGWGVCGKFGTVSSLACDDVLTFDHCTFAKNRNASTCSNFAGFEGDAPAQHTYFKGCVFWENRHRSEGLSCAAANSNTRFTNCYADIVNEAFVVTAENGNVGEGDVKFADAENLDFRPVSGSCLVDRGGAFADWMGTGRRSPVQDLGAGYVIGSVGTYGVTVGRNQSNSRRCGAASDIGCCELWWAPGFIMSFK